MPIELIHGDCLVEMGAIPDGSIDMILADLPYGTTACKWDTVIPFEPLWAHYKRVIKRNGAIVLFAGQPFTSALIMSNPTMFRYTWVWDKRLSTGFLDANRRPLKRHDDVCIFYSAQPTYNPQKSGGVPYTKTRNATPALVYHQITSMVHVNENGDRFPTSILSMTNANQAGKQHPTQKPVALLEYLIKTYTNEGETVLDNTMGSGSTLVACVNTNRNGVGIEQDAGYFAIAQKRIEDALNKARQPELDLVG